MKELDFIRKYIFLLAFTGLIGSTIFFHLGKRVGAEQDVTSIEEFVYFVCIFGLFCFLFSLFISDFLDSIKEHIKGEVNKNLLDYRTNIFNCIDDIKSTIGYIDNEDKNDLSSSLEKLK